MASFSDIAFDTSAFSVGAFDFGSSPPATPTGPIGGGYVHEYKPTKRDISKARKRLGLEDEISRREAEAAARIIADVAARQARSLELDEQKRFEELLRNLELEGLQFDARYLEALNRQREILINAEIAARFRALAIREEEELMLLVMIAAGSI